MFNNFKDYFISFDFVKDFFLILLGAAISYVWRRSMSVLTYWKAKHRLNQQKDYFKRDGIVTLDSAYPSYKFDDIMMDFTGEEYYLSIPEEQLKILQKMDESYQSREQIVFNNKMTLKELGDSMGIPDFEELIDFHKRKTAEQFILKIEQGQELFNNKKFGIRKIIRSRSVTNEENSTLQFKLYKTDYFTHRVMRSVYSELKNKKAEISLARELNDINLYYSFLTSLGINSLLILETERMGDLLVLMKRSKNMANMEKEQLHVSMNEGLSITDVEQDKISIQLCTSRGYREELGIERELQNEFKDLFITMDHFEIGITAITKVKIERDDFALCYGGAKDGSMETTGHCLVSDNPKEIKQFLKNNIEITKACRYCLAMYISRKI